MGSTGLRCRMSRAFPGGEARSPDPARVRSGDRPVRPTRARTRPPRRGGERVPIPMATESFRDKPCSLACEENRAPIFSVIGPCSPRPAGYWGSAAAPASTQSTSPPATPPDLADQRCPGPICRAFLWLAKARCAGTSSASLTRRSGRSAASSSGLPGCLSGRSAHRPDPRGGPMKLRPLPMALIVSLAAAEPGFAADPESGPKAALATPRVSCDLLDMRTDAPRTARNAAWANNPARRLCGGRGRQGRGARPTGQQARRTARQGVAGRFPDLVCQGLHPGAEHSDLHRGKLGAVPVDVHAPGRRGGGGRRGRGCHGPVGGLLNGDGRADLSGAGDRCRAGGGVDRE
jgi:hypothetical protein